MKQKFFLLFLVITILTAFGLGTWFGKSQVICEVCPPSELNFSLFWEVWKTLEDKFVDKDKLDTGAMIYGAISGMVASLDDPYTVFLEPQDAKKFIEDVKGAFEGVGMEIDIKDSQLQVVAPLEGTPAQEAGLKAEDKITGVDGESTAGITIGEAVNWIRGPKGSKVVLTIYREEWGETREVEIIRGVIEIPSLKLELREDNIAYLHLYQFSEKAGYDFSRAAIDILESSSDRIILDLRNNPGGYLEISQVIGGWFLERGEIITIEDFGEEKEKKNYLAEGNGNLVPYPIVVLINKGSASASEILAGALRDNRGVKLIGQTSFGKGSVQELANLTGGSSLKVTIAKWLTPNGVLITEEGLSPDIEVEITEEDIENEIDSQLDKAIEIVKSLK